MWPDSAEQAKTMHRRCRIGALLAATVCGATLGLAAPASAVPAISGSDADVWNAGSPGVRYVLTTDEGNRKISWTLEETQPGADGPVPGGSRSGSGRSPVTVLLPDIGDGSFRLVARDREREPARRTFVVDRTPPVIRVTQPAEGWTVVQGVAAAAAYSCNGAISCAGTVEPGAALDTSRPGPATFRIDASDAAGNSAVVQTTFRVLAPDSPVPAPPVPAPPVPPEPATPAAPVPPAPTTPGVVAVRAGAGPRPLNAARLLPHLNGVVASRRPMLRWPAIVGARFFNVQVFRLRPGARASKVASLFPKTNRVRLPRGRLRDGGRYAWRVWPYMRGGFTAAPLGLSLFSVRLGRR
jgi:hypothetical protein